MGATNPAARLHKNLTALLAASNSERMRQAVGRVFSVDVSETAELLQLMATLIHQIAEARAQVEQVNGANHDLYMRPLEELSKAFSQISLGEKVATFEGRLTPTTLASLEFTAEFLRSQNPQSDVPKKALANLTKQIEEILGDIRASELDDKIKSAVVSRLEQVRRALIEYDLRGPEGVLEALDLNLGYIVRTLPAVQSRPAVELLQKTGEAIVKIYNVVTAAVGLAQLGSGTLDSVLKIGPGA